MNFAGLIFLILAHYLSGKGILRLFHIDLKPVPATCLAMIIGVPLVSFAPCILQLLGLPIAPLPAIIAVVILTSLCSIPLIKNFKKPVLLKLSMPVYYEWPFIIACTFLVALSAWRAFYYPPYARDMLSGPELLAEFAVREKTMISSVFTVDLHSTNNYFKSPFITSLQILYKLLVCPFGQLWLSLLVIPFNIWLYSILKARVHALIAGFLLFIFIAIPELYCYTFIILYDYSNMIFFFAGYYFLCQFMQTNKQAYFLLAAFLFGLATYIRTETLLFIVMTAPLLLAYCVRQKYTLAKTTNRLLLFFIIPTAFYVLCIHVFIRLFIPLPLHLGSQVDPASKNFSFFITRFQQMNSHLIFSKPGILLFGYFIFFFCALLPFDLFLFRKFNQEARIALFGIAVIYIGLPLLGYLIPLVDLDNTTKRGLFKLLPLMLLYMANSSSIQYLSAKLTAWENVYLGLTKKIETASIEVTTGDKT